jgi:hypothetical protein
VAVGGDRVAVVDVGVRAGLAVGAELAFRAAAEVAVQRRVLPPMCGVPIPAFPITPRV